MTVAKLPNGWQHRFMLFNFIHKRRIFPVGCLLFLCAWASAIAAEKADVRGRGRRTCWRGVQGGDGAASGGYLVGLAEPGQGVKFAGLAAAGKLAIRYASVNAGTISVAVNDQPARKVNVHSSGALTNSVLHAIIDVAIPAKRCADHQHGDQRCRGEHRPDHRRHGDLGLPPDIWNLPPLPVAVRSVFRRLEGIEPALHRAGVVARCQIRRVGALGPAVHARGWRLVCARHVSGGQRAISITTPITSVIRRNMVTRTSLTTG
jgi:hypothetical protein